MDLKEMDLNKVLRVAAFCLTPKLEVLTKMDAWVLYTGDGWELPTYMLKQWLTFFRGNPVSGHIHGENSPKIFITGPDNLLLAENKQLNADNFASWLINKGIPKDYVIADSSTESMYTHGQAQSLIKAAREHGWKKVALFSSWYHMMRSWLTTLARLGDTDLAILPEPGQGLSFFGENKTLEGKPSGWHLFNDNMLKRLLDYQEKGNCASFDFADAYIEKNF